MSLEVKIQETNRHPKLNKKIKYESSQSQEFELQYHQIKKLGLPLNKNRLRMGNWTPQENLIYLNFLQNNKKNFISEQQRRKNKVFYRLSKILKKRTPDQCRSHHQKLQMKYEDDIEQIILSIRKKLEKKCPSKSQDEIKKTEQEKKKTGVMDVQKVQNQEGGVLQQGEYHKLLKVRQGQLILSIFVDNLKSWI